jgi:hypothetical protein
MVVCGADFVMEVVVFCGTALFFFFAGTPWTEEGSTYSTRRRKNKFSG